MNTKEGFCCRKGAVRDTRICRPKYASLEYGLFWTKGHREPAITAEALKLGHRVSFVKEIYIGLVNKISICRNVSPIYEDDFYQLFYKWRKVKVKVAQLCPTVCEYMDYTVCGIVQARILEWVTFPSPGDLPNPGIEPRSPTLQAHSLPAKPQGKPRSYLNWNNRIFLVAQWIRICLPIAGDTGLIPGLGRFRMLQRSEAHAQQILSPWAATTKPMCCNYWISCTYSLCFATKEGKQEKKNVLKKPFTTDFY